MRHDATHAHNNLHFHDGGTCHGFPTLSECETHALNRRWEGMILERTDKHETTGKQVKCYSLIDCMKGDDTYKHYAKQGKFVSEVYSVRKAKRL